MRKQRIQDDIKRIVKEEGSVNAALNYLWFERHVAVKSLKEIKELVYDLLNTFDEVENGLSDKQLEILDKIDSRINSWDNED